METKSAIVIACEENNVEKVENFNIKSLRVDIVMRAFKAALSKRSNDVLYYIANTMDAPIYHIIRHYIKKWEDGEYSIDYTKISHVIVKHENIIFNACSDGRLSDLKNIIDCGVDYQYNKNLPLMIACGKGHLAIAQFLIDTIGVDISKCGDALMKFASHGNRVNIIEYLQSKGIAVTE